MFEEAATVERGDEVIAARFGLLAAPEPRDAAVEAGDLLQP